MIPLYLLVILYTYAGDMWPEKSRTKRIKKKKPDIKNKLLNGLDKIRKKKQEKKS